MHRAIYIMSFGNPNDVGYLNNPDNVQRAPSFDPFGDSSWYNSAISGQNRNIIDKWLNPQGEQFTEFAQQNYLLDRQHAFAAQQADPVYRMQQMRKAGINPNTAAQGIAGASPASAPSSPSAASTPDGLSAGDVVGAVGAGANAIGALAGAAKDFAEARSIWKRTNPEIQNIIQDTKTKLAAAGLDEANTAAILIDNTYRGQDWENKIAIQRQQFRNMQQELFNMKANHDFIRQQIDESIERIELMKTQEGENIANKALIEAKKDQIDEDLRFTKECHDFRERHNLFIESSGLNDVIWQNLLEGDSGQIDNILQTYSDYMRRLKYAEQIGVQDAIVDDAFKQALNETLGQNEASIDYDEYKAELQQFHDLMQIVLKAELEQPNAFDTVTMAIKKLIQLFGSVGAKIDNKRPVRRPARNPVQSVMSN